MTRGCLRIGHKLRVGIPMRIQYILALYTIDGSRPKMKNNKKTL